jgi:uncharacterized protein involved in exopolysaccharide biosynthesis
LSQPTATTARSVGIGLALVAASSVAVYLATGLVPKEYESRLVLLFPAASTGSGQPSILIPGQGKGGDQDVVSLPLAGISGAPLIGSSPTTAEGILESESCRRFVVAELGLGRKWGLPPERAAKELAGQVNVRVDENRFLRLSARAGSPVLAKDIADAYARYLEQESVSLTLNVGKAHRAALEKRLEASQQTVDAALANLLKIAADHPAMDDQGLRQLIVDGEKLLGQAKASAEGAKKRLDTLEAGIRSALKGGSTNSLTATAESEALTEIAKELELRRLQLKDAQERFLDGSEELADARRKAAAAEQAVRDANQRAKDELSSGGLARLIVPRAELAGLEATVASYQSALSRAAAMAKRAPEDAARVKAAEKRFDAAVGLSENLRAQVEYARIAEESDPSRFEVVDAPFADGQYVAPRRGLITGGWAAACLGLLLWRVFARRATWVA